MTEAPSSTAGLTVCIVFGTYPPDPDGGAGFIGRYARALADAGVSVHVITTRTAERMGRIEEGGGVVVHGIVPDWRLRSARSSLPEASRILDETQAQLVHVFFPDAIFQTRYQVPALIGLGHIPLISTFWNLGIGRRSPMRIRTEALALMVRSRTVTSHDPTYLAALQRIVGWAHPVKWLPVGSNIAGQASAPRNELRRKLGLPDGVLLSYFGYLDFTRGMEDLLDALVEIRRTYDATLVIVGGASRDDGYRNEVARRGLADAVIWTGFLTEQDAADAISATDLCVLPYRRNSIGRSALAAALTLGVPTVLGGVASRVAPLVPGTSVALTPPGNAQRLAETVCELLADPARRTALADGARAAATSFGWEHIASLGIDVYRSALSRG